MKTKSIIAGLIILALVAGTSVWPRKAGAQGQSQVQMWTAVFDGEEDYAYGVPVGLVVSTYSGSSRAPKFHRGDNLSEVINQLREMGAEVLVHNGSFLTFSATYPATRQ